MRPTVITLVFSICIVGMFTACGPSQEEIQRRKQARQDSLEQVRQQRLAQQKKERAEQAKKDSMAAASQKEEKKEQSRIEFDQNGAFAVQVESWRSKEKAESQVKKWVNRGYKNAYVVQFGKKETGNIWFRVRLGRLATKDMAKKLEDKLQRNFDAKSWISMANSDMADNTSGTE